MGSQCSREARASQVIVHLIAVEIPVCFNELSQNLDQICPQIPMRNVIQLEGNGRAAVERRRFKRDLFFPFFSP